MNSKRIFFIMAGVVGLLSVLAIGGLILGNSVLGKQGKKLLALKLEDRIIEEQQAALVAATKEIEQYADLEKIAKSVVPQDKDQARTIREINNIAEQSGIKLKTINFQTSSLGQAAPKPTASDEATGATPLVAAPPLTQVKAVEGIPGVYSLELSISPIENQGISYAKFLDFLERLEKNRRTAHVAKIAVIPQPNGTISFSLTLNVYVKP